MTTPAPTTSTAERDAWEPLAGSFDDRTTPHTMTLGRDIVDRLGISAGMRVLDVAAGSGGLSLPAARAGAEVIAVDIAPTMIARLRKRAAAEDLDIVAEVGDGTALDLDDDAVDVAMSLNGISLFGDLAGGLREAVRVTRPGGEVAIGTFAAMPQVEYVAFFFGALRAAAGASLQLPPGPLPPFRLADPDVLRATLHEAGLGAVEVDTIQWTTSFASAEDYLDTVLASNPVTGRLVAGFDEAQRDELLDVLRGMLRERSAGDGEAVLCSRMLLGHGTA